MDILVSMRDRYNIGYIVILLHLYELPCIICW